MDTIKHSDVFQAYKLGSAKVAVIGAGSVGSAVAMEIAKLGVTNITIFDDDIIESHNIPNQVYYGPADVGKKKVFVLADRIEQFTGYRPYVVDDVAGKSKLYYEIILVCVDTMSARSDIFKKCVFLNGKTNLYIDGSIGTRIATGYAFSPLDPVQAREYMAELYPDEDVLVETGGCGISQTIGATVKAMTSMMTWMFIEGTQGPLTYNEILFSVNPWESRSARKFDSSSLM